MEKGKCPGNCGKFHPRICNVMKQKGFCNRGQICYYTHFGDTKNRDINSNANNQRNHHYESKQNSHTYRQKSMHNLQWQQNTREAYHYDNHSEYNRRREQNMDFYMNQHRNWQILSKPLMERTAEIMAERMAERMMWNNY